MAKYRFKRKTVDAYEISKSRFVSIDGNIGTVASKGDFVVIEENGRKTVMGAKDFSKLYELVD